MENNFKFTAPLTLVKGKDGSDVTTMKIGGVASTTATDFDGEFMNPKGFDISYFKKYGFINWAHQSTKDPLAIIGRPSKVTIDSTLNELFVEATLFKSNPKAIQVYKLGEMLEQEGHHLAFSIEGKVTKRNPDNPREVLAAKITGMAITPTPKNNDSVARIVKGLDESDLSGQFSNEFIKGILSAYEDTDDETQEKAMTAGAVAPITRESLVGEEKDTVMAKEQKLTKGQVMTILRDDCPNTSEEMLEEVYNLTVKIEKSVIMEKPEISSEALSKAYAELGISKGVEAEASTPEEVATAETVVEEAPVVEMPTAEVVEEVVEKGIDTDVLEASRVVLESAGFTVLEKGVEATTAGVATPEVKDVVEKGIEAPEATVDFASILEKGLAEINTGVNGKFGAVATILKGLGNQIDGVKSENAELKAQIEGFGNASQGRRSVTAAGHLEKGTVNGEFGENSAPSVDENLKPISKTADKQNIIELADNACGLSKGTCEDMGMANDIAMFEGSNYASPKLEKAINDLGYRFVD